MSPVTVLPCFQKYAPLKEGGPPRWVRGTVTSPDSDDESDPGPVPASNRTGAFAGLEVVRPASQASDISITITDTSGETMPYSPSSYTEYDDNRFSIISNLPITRAYIDKILRGDDLEDDSHKEVVSSDPIYRDTSDKISLLSESPKFENNLLSPAFAADEIKYPGFWKTRANKFSHMLWRRIGGGNKHAKALKEHVAKAEAAKHAEVMKAKRVPRAAAPGTEFDEVERKLREQGYW